MRRTALVLAPLFLIACQREPVAPDLASEGVGVPVDAQSLSQAGGAERIESRWDQPVEDLFEPADFPCLTEPVSVSGTIQSHLVIVGQPTGGAHFLLHQTTAGLTAVGLTTGHTYQQSGPYTRNWTSPRMEPSFVQWTLVNKIHLVGSGGDGSLFLRTLIHVTFDAATGESRVEVVKDDALCH